MSFCLFLLNKFDFGEKMNKTSNMRDLKKEIGERVKLIRSKGRLTLEGLGDLLGVGKSAVFSYEDGNSYPNPESLIKIAELGNVSLDWLITGKGWCSFESGGEVRETIPDYKVDNQPEIWFKIIMTVEEFLQGENLTLPPRKKADLCTILYEMFYEGGQINKESIARLYSLAK